MKKAQSTEGQLDLFQDMYQWEVVPCVLARAVSVGVWLLPLVVDGGAQESSVAQCQGPGRWP